MPRKTRAAAKAEEAVLAATDASQEAPLPPTPNREREPLRSRTPNSVDSLDNERASTEDMERTKAKKGKKGGAKKKGKKTKTEKVEQQPQMRDDTAEDAAVDGLPDAFGQEPVVVSEPVPEPRDEPKLPPAEERPTSSLGRSTRVTRRQRVKAEVEEEEVVAEEDAPEPKAIAGELVLSPPAPVEEEETQLDAVPTIMEHPQDIEAPSPMSQELPDRMRPEPLSLVASNTTSRRTSQVEDPIEAIDALEDEIEEVAKIIPTLDSPISPVKPKAAAKMDRSRHSKPPTSVKGMGPANRTNKLTTTTQPSATARIRALAEPRKPATTLSRSGSTKTRPVSVSDPKLKDRDDGEVKENKPVDYLTAKRRPISMQFPAPPPPPKSKKPPTTSNFTLPGDAVAGRLKAARAERLKREEEEAAKKREFKARPVPIVKPKPVEVKQTAASRARQSIIGEPRVNTEAGGLKRSSTVTGATTTAAIKRGSTIAAKRSSVIGVPKPTSAASVANTAQKHSSIVASKGTTALNVSKPRVAPAETATKDRAPSSTSSNPLSRSVSASEVAAQRQKGKEVYNRDKVEKEAREKAQKEKDDAIKKARAEAAERGRQASREWAEKQRKLALEKKLKAAAAEQNTGPCASPAVIAA